MPTLYLGQSIDAPAGEIRGLTIWRSVMSLTEESYTDAAEPTIVVVLAYPRIEESHVAPDT
ncbi:hypothetical protein NG831_06910 [Xanthomonas sacchari]|uniref:hypothetical protein n=1 Tax=Xanthomonas TaxID=338 RepID=UPI0012636B16|nr:MULTISPECIES: hypothetical protein [Xanthomonas]UYK67884.1 hypothetical protein NG831_06910 [Xanthomonas sacchari]